MLSIWHDAIWWQQLLLIAAGVLLLALFGWLLARLMKSIRYETIWWKQLLLIVAGGLLVALLGSLLVSPTGPGSGRIGLALLAAYAVLLVLLGPKFTKITGFALLCIFLAAFAMSTRDRKRHLDKMRKRVKQMKTSDATIAPHSTPLDAEHKQATSQPGD
jgi:hypothetical protein